VNQPPAEPARLTQARRFGLQALILENELLRVEILPEAGGNIRSICFKPANRELLWHNPMVRPAAHAPGSVFDDVWAGGWDDLFPNAIAELHAGGMTPDHGELWTRRWEWKIVDDRPAALLHLWCMTPQTPARVDKWVLLRPGEPQLRVRYRIANLGNRPFAYSFTLHPALPASVPGRIDLGAGAMQIDPWNLAEPPPTPLRYCWPLAAGRDGAGLDMRQILPARAGTAGLHYVAEWQAGWCAITDVAAGIGLGLVFSSEAFPACALFFSYGGFRGHQTVVVEPSTSWPASLAAAEAAGRAPVLPPGRAIEYDVRAVAYSGMRGVAHMTPAGEVVPD